MEIPSHRFAGCDYFSRRATPRHTIRSRKDGSGAFSAGMLDFIPLLWILSGLLARGDNWYTSAKACDRYPFLFLILDPGVFPFRLANSTSDSLFSFVFFSPRQLEVTVNHVDEFFPYDARSSCFVLRSFACLSDLFFFFLFLFSDHLIVRLVAIACNTFAWTIKYLYFTLFNNSFWWFFYLHI